MNFWGLGRKKASRTVASSSGGQSLQVGVVTECESHLRPRFTEGKAGVRLWWCYPESSKYKDEVSVDTAGVSIHFRTFVKSFFLFPCAETINKLPSFTRALHYSQIVDNRHIVWAFQRGKRLRKDMTPIYFPWHTFCVLFWTRITVQNPVCLHLLQCTSWGFPTSLCNEDKIYQLGQDKDGPEASLAIPAEGLSLFGCPR